MTYAYPYSPRPPKRSGCGCNVCLGLLLVTGLAIAVLVILGAMIYPRLPQLAASAATALSGTPTPTQEPPLDLCTLLTPLGTTRTSTDPYTNPYPISEGENSYLLYPAHSCQALLTSEGFSAIIQQFSTPLNAQRVEKYVRTCPQASGLYKQYTCKEINLGDGGFEIEGTSNPDCGSVPIVHWLKWRRGCFLVSTAVAVYERLPTPEEVQQVWDLARQVDAQLQTIPACPK